jgi:hypothetical protein
MNPEPASQRADDKLVTTLSRWLAGHVDDAQLRTVIEAAPLDELSGDKAAGVRELLDDLGRGASREELQVSVREALELLAL